MDTGREHILPASVVLREAVGAGAKARPRLRPLAGAREPGWKRPPGRRLVARGIPV